MTRANFKDPLTAHGITDALRDAELLARAVVDGSAAAFEEYERTRTGSRCRCSRSPSRSRPTAGTDEIRELLLAESAAMKPEVAALRALDLPSRRAA